MKWLAVIAAGLAVVLVAGYVVLFTGFGNGLIAPVVQSRIEESLGFPVQLEEFTLRPASFALNLALDEKNRIEVDGTYALFSRSVDARYRVRLDDLARLAPLTRKKLFGRLHTEGTVQGTQAALTVEGMSDLADSDTTYRIALEQLRPTAVHAAMKNAAMAQLLALTGQKPYAEARLDLTADLTDLNPKAPVGEIDLRLRDGRMDRAVMKKDFGIDLPETRFAVETRSQMDKAKIRYTARLDSNLARIRVEGDLDAQSTHTDVVYDIDIDELALFRPVTGTPLRGPLSTRGTVRGDAKKMSVIGRSDLAGSDTHYDLDLQNFKPSRFIAKIQGADLSKLLYLGGQPDLAAGRLDVDFQLDSLDPEKLQGEAGIHLRRGSVNIAAMKRLYGVDLPAATLALEGNARLAGKTIHYETGLTSNLARIESKGTVVPQTQAMDISYDVGIKKLELFKPLTGMALRGPLSLSGTAKGDKKRLQVRGCSDLAAGETCLDAELREFAPAVVKADLRHLKLAGLLSTLALPPYADAVLDADVDIADARTGSLSGTIRTKLAKGKVNRATMEREFDLKMPETSFGIESVSTLAGNRIDTRATITSSLAEAKIAQARYETDKALFTSDYRADIPDLNRLSFLADRRLKGAVQIVGEIKKGKDLDATAHCDTLGGAVDAKLHNDDLHADLKELKTLAMMEMLVYPKVFDSGLTGVFDYNLKAKKGKLDANLAEGRFVPTLMTTLIDRLARFDLTREVFTGKLTSGIDDEKIVSDVSLTAENASVTGKAIRLNTRTRQIDARLDVVANDNPVGVVIRGDVSKPKVDVDVKNLLRREAERYIEKQVGGQFKNLLKGLFK